MWYLTYCGIRLCLAFDQGLCARYCDHVNLVNVIVRAGLERRVRAATHLPLSHPSTKRS